MRNEKKLYILVHHEQRKGFLVKCKQDEGVIVGSFTRSIKMFHFNTNTFYRIYNTFLISRRSIR